MVDDNDTSAREGHQDPDQDKQTISEPPEGSPAAGAESGRAPAAPSEGRRSGHARRGSLAGESQEEDSPYCLAACIPAVFWSADGCWPPGRVKPDRS